MSNAPSGKEAKVRLEANSFIGYVRALRSEGGKRWPWPWPWPWPLDGLVTVCGDVYSQSYSDETFRRFVHVDTRIRCPSSLETRSSAPDLPLTVYGRAARNGGPRCGRVARFEDGPHECAVGGVSDDVEAGRRPSVHRHVGRAAEERQQAKHEERTRHGAPRRATGRRSDTGADGRILFETGSACAWAWTRWWPDGRAAACHFRHSRLGRPSAGSDA
ncbi:hypothetical protein V9T40_006922 [Parthenolecanium corni]|uniref:Uncharacterized protein n=1 Tax=Parthenolecanium corni TaxID=536013 RepID=A0AAN9U243_9HEMI